MLERAGAEFVAVRVERGEDAAFGDLHGSLEGEGALLARAGEEEREREREREERGDREAAEHAAEADAAGDARLARAFVLVLRGGGEDAVARGLGGGAVLAVPVAEEPVEGVARRRAPVVVAAVGVVGVHGWRSSRESFAPISSRAWETSR